MIRLFVLVFLFLFLFETLWDITGVLSVTSTQSIVSHSVCTGEMSPSNNTFIKLSI